MFRNAAIPVRNGVKSLHSVLRRGIGQKPYSGPPIKSYHGLRGPISLFWANSPPQIKVFGGIIGLGLAIANLHPNVMVTLGPPLGVGGWLLHRQREKREYGRAVKAILPQTLEDFENPDQRIRIARYDETSVELALEGIENQLQFFQKQILELVEKRIVDSIALSESSSTPTPDILRPLVDENGQVTVHLGTAFETFVTTKAEVPVVSDDTIMEFTKLSVPYYGSKNARDRKRLGVAEVTLLEIPSKAEQTQDYRIVIELIENKLWGGKCKSIAVLPGHGIQKTSFCK